MGNISTIPLDKIKKFEYRNNDLPGKLNIFKRFFREKKEILMK